MSENVLMTALKRKQENFPHYSMRSLARDLGISPSYLSKILNGKKGLPLKYIGEIEKRLDLDQIERKKLETLVKKEPVETSTSKSSTERLVKYEPFGDGDIRLLEKWYYLAILDLTTCDNFIYDLDWMSERLGIGKSILKDSIKWLLDQGYLKEDCSSIRKSTLKLRFPASKSKNEIRNYHSQCLKKAINTMESKNSDKDYKERAIHTISIAGNPDNLKAAQEILISALYEAAELLSEGECTELYQLNINQIPITRNIDQ